MLPEGIGFALKTKEDSNKKEVVMKKVLTATLLSVALASVPLLAQEKKEMPMKEGMR